MRPEPPTSKISSKQISKTRTTFFQDLPLVSTLEAECYDCTVMVEHPVRICLKDFAGKAYHSSVTKCRSGCGDLLRNVVVVLSRIFRTFKFKLASTQCNLPNSESESLRFGLGLREKSGSPLTSAYTITSTSLYKLTV